MRFREQNTWERGKREVGQETCYEKMCVRWASLSAVSPDLSSDELFFVWLITDLAIADHATGHKWKYFKSPKSVLFDGLAAVGIESSKSDVVDELVCGMFR